MGEIISLSHRVGEGADAGGDKDKALEVEAHNLRSTRFKWVEVLDEMGLPILMDNGKFKKEKFEIPINEGDVVTILGNRKQLVEDLKKFYMENLEQSFIDWVPDRKTVKGPTYWDHLNDSKQQGLYEQMIIGFGDMEFWKDKDFKNENLTKVFEKMLKVVQDYYPNFKIINATIHYDEVDDDTGNRGHPHMHLVGVPIAEFDKGLKLRVSKNKVFGKVNGGRLGEHMRAFKPIIRKAFIDEIRKSKIIDVESGDNIAIDLEINKMIGGTKKNVSIKTYKEQKTKDNELKADNERITARAVKEKAVSAENKKQKAENDAKTVELNANGMKFTKMISKFQKSKIIQNKQEIWKAETLKAVIEEIYGTGKMTEGQDLEMLEELGYKFMEGTWVLELKPDFGIKYLNVINGLVEIGLTPEQIEELKKPPLLSPEDHFDIYKPKIDNSNISME